LLMARWQTDPVFIQRTRIRDLRRAHPELHPLEAEYRLARDVQTTSPVGARMAILERQLHRANKAIVGLERAASEAVADRRTALEAKRDAFLAQRLRLDKERAEITNSCTEQRQLSDVTEALQRVRQAIGLDREEARLAAMLTERGRGSGKAGTAFEEHALTVTQRHILPDFEGDPVGLHVLRHVRLGAAGVELDFAIVRRRGGVDEPVNVLAIVEVKRNINDLAHGFRRRQLDLTWLTGDATAYDPAEFRTGHFRSGHFDRPAAHWQDDQAFVFAPDSFHLFERDPASGYFLDRLYLLTRAGPIWGLSAVAQCRIAARVSTDEDLDPVSESDVVRLFEWCRSLAGPVETPDVLQQFTQSAVRARQLLLIT
jgi:hypothetical protein